MNTKKFASLLLLGLLQGFASIAQDIHFSQFYETTVLRNPALTGIFSDDFKAGVVYRNQWSSIGYPFKTMLASAETRFAINHTQTDFLTVSALFYSDKAGQAALKTTGIYPAINYNKFLEDDHNSYLSVGFAGGYLQRSFDMGRLTFDNQYQGGMFVPSLGAGETLPVAKLASWDLGTGVSFNSSLGEDHQLVYFAGLSAYHFTQPRANFSETSEAVNLATRWNLSGGINLTKDDTWSMQIHGNYAMQGKYREAIIGGFLRWGPPDRSNQKSLALSGGAFYRFGDAIVPMLKLEYKKESIGLSYDINTSALKAASRMRGGLELTAFVSGFLSRRYDDKRACPRF